MSTIEKALAKRKAAKKVDEKSEQAEIEKTVNQNDLSIDETNKTQVETSTLTQVHAEQNQHNDATIILNKDSLVERGFMYDGSTDRIAQEEFRGIKRKLLNNAFGSAAKTLHHSNLIMVTSSNPNEGKTFISINLALSIALEQDKTVLLVDADVLKSSVGKELEFENKNGLVEYLLSEVTSLGDVIYNTSINNLKIIPAGKPHNLTNELLASDRMASLAKELAERYSDRIIIFDCPPILGVTETPILADLMGQSLVVVEQSKTKIEDVKRATSQLNENLAIGLVMNKTLKSARDAYGYYGYGYGSKAK